MGTDETSQHGRPDRLVSRRAVVGSGSLLAGGLLAASCSAEDTPVRSDDIRAPERTPLPPDDSYEFLSPEEARTLRAFVARLVPGTDAEPGAVQMGVLTYVDTLLASSEGFPQPTYMSGPFAEPYEPGSAPPEGPDVVPVAEPELYRYGYQSGMTPQDLYREGLAAVDRYAQSRFGSLFAELDGERQDELLTVFEGVADRATEQHPGFEDADDPQDDEGPPDDELDQAEGVFGDVSPGEFFSIVHRHAIEGMFADPAYGGNRGLAGWLLIGWPGAQRSYSPAEMMHGTTKEPQPMDGLTPMNPDRPDERGRPALVQQHGGVHDHGEEG